MTFELSITVNFFKMDTPVRRSSIIGWFWPNSPLRWTSVAGSKHDQFRQSSLYWALRKILNSQRLPGNQYVDNGAISEPSF